PAPPSRPAPPRLRVVSPPRPLAPWNVSEIAARQDTISPIAAWRPPPPPQLVPSDVYTTAQRAYTEAERNRFRATHELEAERLRREHNRLRAAHEETAQRAYTEAERNRFRATH